MPLSGEFANFDAVQAIIDAIPTPIFLKDRQHRLLMVNAAFAEVVGETPGALVSALDDPYFSVDEVECFRSADCQVFETGALHEYEETITRADGQTRTFLTRKQPLELTLGEGRVETCLAAVSSDVTSIREAEALARQAERERAAETRILEIIARGAELADILLAVTTEVDALFPEFMTSILIHDQAAARLRVAVAPRLPTAFLAAIDGLLVAPHNGSCGAAVATKRQVVVRDTSVDPLWREFRELALTHRLRACWSTPIVNAAGEALGCFAVYCQEPREPEPEVLAFLQRLSHLTGIAIERDRQDAELRGSRERFQQLADTIEEVFWISDASGQNLVYVSPAYDAIWGRSRELLYERAASWLDPIHPDDRPRIEAMLAQHAEGFEAEYRIIRPDGSVRWISDRGLPVRAADGRVLRTAGVARDITAVRMKDAALRESEERFRIVARTTADLIVDWDLDSGEVWVGAEGVQTVLGYGAHETSSRAEFWLERIHPDDLPGLVATVQAAAAGQLGEIASVEYRLKRRDGSWARLVCKGQMLRTADGGGQRLIASVVDVTQQRDLQEKLMRAQRMEAVGQLTGGIAHDFNNLLTAVIGSAEALTFGLNDRPELLGAAELILEAAERGADLVRQMLAFSRKQALRPEPVNCSSLLESVSQMARRTFSQEIEIVSRVGAPDLHCLADPTQLTSALLNLCINARDAMPDGGRLTIQAERSRARDSGAPEVLLSVTDTGSGMAPETQARALEPFFTTKPAGKGSGLGLSMVYGFVVQSGGRLEIDSAPGAGSVMKIFLPESQPGCGEAPAAEPRPAREVRSVLLVEDDALVRAQLERQLASLGYDAIAADCARTALDRLAERPNVEILLTDVVMPGGMNGRQLADHAQLLKPGLKVIFTSGHTEDAILTSARIDRTAAFLPKPYRRADLARVLGEVLGEAHA